MLSHKKQKMKINKEYRKILEEELVHASPEGNPLERIIPHARWIYRDKQKVKKDKRKFKILYGSCALAFLAGALGFYQMNFESLPEQEKSKISNYKIQRKIVTENYDSQRDAIQKVCNCKLDSLKKDYQNKLNQLEKELK